MIHPLLNDIIDSRFTDAVFVIIGLNSNYQLN